MDSIGPASILVVSHSCATPVNQQIYAEIQKLTGWNFTLLVPRDWKDEFGNRLDAGLLPGFSAELVNAPVLGNGSIILHAYAMRLRRFLQARRFGAIYVNHEPYGIATVQVCLANRLSVNAPFGFYSCQNIPKKYPPPFCWAERFVYRSSDFAFPITGEVGEVLRQKGYKGDMSVAPLPVDPVLYQPAAHGPDVPAGVIEKRDGETVIGYVGRMVEAKGLRTLVDALSRIPHRNWKLVVIGSGPFGAEFDSLISAAGLKDRVQRLGYVPHTETPRYLAALDMLVLPSETQANWKEQFGRVIVEALACGTPVVGSDSGWIPKLIQSSGGGIVFPERNAGAFAGAMGKMTCDEGFRRSCAESGRAWVLANLTVGAVAKTMAAAISKAMDSREGGLSQKSQNTSADLSGRTLG